MRTRGVGRLATLTAAAALGVGGLVAGATAEARRGAKASIVPVKVLEFKVQPKWTSLVTGRPVKLKIKNLGLRAHELAVVRTDGSPVPTKADGSVDEEMIPESAKIGEVKKVRPKKTKILRVQDLPPGDFVFFCNLVDKEPDGTTLSHYAQGMHSDFSVVPIGAAVSTTTSEAVAPQRLAVRREYPAGGPTDPVFPPNTPAYEWLAAGRCEELLNDIINFWNNPNNRVADAEGADTPTLYLSAAYACLGRWDDAIRVFGQISNVSAPLLGNRNGCERKAVLEWLTSLVAARRRDPAFSPVFVKSSARSPCPADGSTSTDATGPTTSTTLTPTAAPSTSSPSTTSVNAPPTSVPPRTVP